MFTASRRDGKQHVSVCVAVVVAALALGSLLGTRLRHMLYTQNTFSSPHGVLLDKSVRVWGCPELETIF